jgi:hypothetical protein
VRTLVVGIVASAAPALADSPAVLAPDASMATTSPTMTSTTTSPTTTSPTTTSPTTTSPAATTAISPAVAAAAATAIEPAIVTWTPPPVLSNTISVGVPSLDGARGLQAGYERWLPDRRLGLGASVQLHESAIGDYTGIRAGVGAEVRWYWRARSFLRAQPEGSMIGWFTGGRFDIASAWTHDVPDHRWLDTGLSLGVTAEVGYRLAPWRALVITPTTGLTLRRDSDVSGRLPTWTRGGIAFGLEVGWMF